MIPRASQKTVAITLPADFTVFAFFGSGSPLKIYCFDCPLSLECSSVSMFSPQLCIDAETRGLRRKSTNPASALIKRDTHLAEIFFTPNFWCKIENSVLWDMPAASTISRTLIRRSLKTISRILSIISEEVTSTGRPERCSSFVDVRSRLNSFTQS
ncbi:hypothetical protein AVEN_106001-1 [Araneus ventricosus]|uniref:Uncharacterized protein n=1 Tax=Araneus ventricosus TaxID=182803 RepID=A0A4Y2ASM6_ARAVE|nr:hypothetical protein AVEN_106001-1 [Araneus ventricosus]